MTDESRGNDALLEWVESLGGDYIWEPELFAVTLMEVELTAEHVARLVGLDGVHQLAVNATQLTESAVHTLASIPGLRSLVLSGSKLEPAARHALEGVGPDIEWVDG